MSTPLERRRPPPAERRAAANPWAIAAVAAAALLFFYLVRLAMLPFLAAAAVAYVAQPAVRWLERALRFPRAAAAATMFAAILAVCAGLGWWCYAALAGEVAAALGDAPRLFDALLVELFGGQDFELLGKHYEAAALANQIAQAAFGGLGDPQRWLDIAFLGITGISALILIAVLLYYFLTSGPELAAGVLWLVPPAHRVEAAEIARRLDPMLRRYILGLLGIVAAATLLAWPPIALVLHLPFALLLSLLTGILELVPVIGPVASAAIVGLLAITRNGLWAAAAFALYIAAFRVVIDRLIGPVILGRAVSLHPVVVIFAFLGGWLVLGVAGVVLAVPAAATLKIVLDYYYTPGERR